MPPGLDPAPFVQVRKAYRDRKAFEESTGLTKKKFRLAGASVAELNVYPFFYIFGEIKALIKSATFTVRREDWEDRVPDELDHDESFIDVSRVESLTREEIQAKRDDPENRFSPIAALSSVRFAELKKLAKKQLRDPRFGVRVSRDTKKLVCYALEAGDDLMRKLRL